jgi:hypothetical protein
MGEAGITLPLMDMLGIFINLKLAKVTFLISIFIGDKKIRVLSTEKYVNVCYKVLRS